MKAASAVSPAAKLFVACLCLCAFSTAVPAQHNSKSGGTNYEAPPSVPVSQVIRSDYLSGNTYRLTENADAEGMLYSFSMWTPFGWYRPASLAMLAIRMQESRALATLNSMKDDPLFVQGITDSARSTVNSAAQAVRRPVKTLRSVPMGLEKFASGVQARADEGPVAGESGKLRNLSEKRKLAAQLGIDPYTDNVQLQEALNTVVSHKNAGALVARIGGMAVDGGTGAVISAAQINKGLQSKLRDMSAPELQKANRKALVALGCSPVAVDNFLDLKGYTASRTTGICDAMTALSSVRNISQYLTFAKPATAPEVPLFHEQQIEMAAGYHTRIHQLKKFGIAGNTGVFTDNRGQRNIFAPVDVVYWSPDVDLRLQMLESDGAGGETHLWITGSATDAAKKQLADAGVTVHEQSGQQLLGY